MGSSNLLIVGAFTVYILFAVGLLLVKQRIRVGKSVKPVIVAPILVSFFAGAGILLYALSQL